MKTLLAEEKIEYFGILPFSLCKVRRPDIIERRGVKAEEIRTAVPFLIPYYVDDGGGNISLYARSGDYHKYSDALFARLMPKLEAKFGGRFLGFADKSPIEENMACAMAGLGMLGDNYMLINAKYGSFVFLGEILTTVEPEVLGYTKTSHEVQYCPHCGACKKECPMVLDHMDCLSAVTQKKGELTEEEQTYIKKYGYAWGCDICQLACPFNKKAIRNHVETPIDFFRLDRISTLTLERLENMSDAEFKDRSFSWRGKAPLVRNLKILDGGIKPEE